LIVSVDAEFEVGTGEEGGKGERKGGLPAIVVRGSRAYFAGSKHPNAACVAC